MDIKYINPFIRATITTIETMLSLTPKRLAPFLKNDQNATGDISAIIGFAGKTISGTVAISMPHKASLDIYELMTGEPVNKMTDDVQDGICELINIVAGAAKQDFYDLDLTFHISIPLVIVGSNHMISHKSGTMALVIPFELGDEIKFTLEVSVKKE